MIDSKVVLITGCSSGIGREAARRFAAAGFRVYASMRRPEEGAALIAEAAARGWILTTPALDVTSDASVDAAVSALLAETGGRHRRAGQQRRLLHAGSTGRDQRPTSCGRSSRPTSSACTRHDAGGVAGDARAR